jgi:hypothetical protein
LISTFCTWRKGAAEETLGLLLLPTGRPGCHFVGAHDEAAAAAIVALFSQLRGTAATLFLHRGADIQMRSTCISHGDKRWEGKTLDEMRKKKIMRRRKKLMNELGFLPSPNVLYL